MSRRPTVQWFSDYIHFICVAKWILICIAMLFAILVSYPLCRLCYHSYLLWARIFCLIVESTNENKLLWIPFSITLCSWDWSSVCGTYACNLIFMHLLSLTLTACFMRIPIDTFCTAQLYMLSLPCLIHWTCTFKCTKLWEWVDVSGSHLSSRWSEEYFIQTKCGSWNGFLYAKAFIFLACPSKYCRILCFLYQIKFVNPKFLGVCMWMTSSQGAYKFFSYCSHADISAGFDAISSK